MTSIALIVLTHNEEVNLPYCLDSVEGGDARCTDSQSAASFAWARL